MATSPRQRPDLGGSGYRRIAVFLIALVTVPTGLLLAVGILMLVFYEAQLNILFGILVLALVGCIVTGSVLSLVFVRKQASLSRLQIDFVSKVSHELRTPLTSIRLFVETLRMQRVTDPAEVARCLDVLSRETVRLTERIERLLDWGRMEAGRKLYERKPEGVEEIIREAIETFASHSMGAPPSITTDLAPGSPEVLADRHALVDALVNLLSNAFKYSPPKSEVTVRLRHDVDQVRISVEDKGVGIAPREHRRIFERFYRVDDRLAREVEGSGLGLAIVRHIVAGHEGHIDVESELGKGSTFTIHLPALRAPTTSVAALPTVETK